MRNLAPMIVVLSVLAVPSALAADQTGAAPSLFNTTQGASGTSNGEPIATPAPTGMKTTIPYTAPTEQTDAQSAPPAPQADTPDQTADKNKQAQDQRLEELKKSFKDANDQDKTADTKAAHPDAKPSAATAPAKAMVFTPQKNDDLVAPTRSFKVE